MIMMNYVIFFLVGFFWCLGVWIYDVLIVMVILMMVGGVVVVVFEVLVVVGFMSYVLY